MEVCSTMPIVGIRLTEKTRGCLFAAENGHPHVRDHRDLGNLARDPVPDLVCSLWVTG
ncbi:hypothetical protein HanRHA438_Chr04g0156771 [Helianthus annuus]|nr:hypothetical protein HanIR_Chr04g0157901 [Helianthus annuus]KAJ0925189.1 hypothetical protein HanRHA438_Chr04g0156771 [Helianthus annuus]